MKVWFRWFCCSIGVIFWFHVPKMKVWFRWFCFSIGMIFRFHVPNYEGLVQMILLFNFWWFFGEPAVDFARGVSRCCKHVPVFNDLRRFSSPANGSGAQASLWRRWCVQHCTGGFMYFYFHPYLGKWSNLTHIFQVGWFNHQLDEIGNRIYTLKNWNGTWKCLRKEKEKHLHTTNFGVPRKFLRVYTPWNLQQVYPWKMVAMGDYPFRGNFGLVSVAFGVSFREGMLVPL